MFKYDAPPALLKDKIILVTGAGSGIGRTAALTYASYGATVVLLGRTTSKLEAVYDEIESNGWPQAAIYPMNLEGASEQDYANLAATLEQEFGHLDGLLNNAGLLGELKPIAQYDAETWQRVMQVNLNAPFLLTRELLPLLRNADHASVIFTSSTVGHEGRANWGAYSVSKFATEGLMQTLADEEDGISQVRVNSLNPGGTRTAMRATAFPGEAADARPAPEEIMPLYLYLMSTDSINESGKAFHAQR
ncbi:3-oxoacyl-ACP reductase [Endozoicomonas montiporae]|uniref:3-oxoacyl-ACP reductase n=2 Tax=Endozoicomonas montiporae TaxID=1027273 RepID=A0A081NAP5_9GAMM|nr:YciK family oxidoreductase [Endozoicomonas montiporae]AMO56791.1 short-chain dehydrogenase/reductase SDR [Endozoicomonas montiporae CL-33]KEQ15518.1 3-oxoacyl-ACP reductase [Endozoicomonas montiporae]